MDEVEIVNPQNKRPTWMILLGFLIILALCYFVGGLAMILLAWTGGISIDENFELFDAISNPEMRPYIKAGIGINHLILFTGSSLLFAYWVKKKKWLKYFYTKKLDASLMLSFILLLICSYPLIGFSATILEGVEWAKQIDEASIDALMKILQMDSIFDLIVNLIIVALLPAIGEELLFRGIIQKGLVANIDNHHIAIIIASIIFSGIHLQIQGFLPKFIIGLILGYAYYWTKSIWYPMIIHFLNNGVQTLILYFVGDQMETMQEEAIKPEMLHLVIVVIISCFLCLLITRDIRKRIRGNQSIKS